VEMTNREAAKFDPEFRAACEVAGVFPSRNQYRKWKYRRGIAYLTAHQTTRAAIDNRRRVNINAFSK
jgi:hypothetical protein